MQTADMVAFLPISTLPRVPSQLAFEAAGAPVSAELDAMKSHVAAAGAEQAAQLAAVTAQMEHMKASMAAMAAAPAAQAPAPAPG